MSCRDAARKRHRLGFVGIPLADELKSFVGRTEQGMLVAVHCRGHAQLDPVRLASSVGGPVTRLAHDELSAEFELEYGLVTPFALAYRPDVLQIFDPAVLERHFPPYTMMTNAGHPEFAIEFFPEQLLSSTSNALVAAVVDSSHMQGPMEHRLGILTGNGPDSGILLWQLINQRIRASAEVECRGDSGFPRVIIESLPQMGLTMELHHRADLVRPAVLEGIERLCNSGATVVGVACNTSQFFEDEIEAVCRRHGTRFVSIVDETARLLRKSGVRNFDLLGIGPVADLSEWSPFRRMVPEFAISVPSERDIVAINEIAFRLKSEGGSDGRAINQLRDLIRRATTTGTVVLALTELSVAFAHQPKSRSQNRYFDTLAILADSMADAYLAERMIAEGTAGPLRAL